MKWQIRLSINVKKQLLNKVFTNNRFNVLSHKENQFINSNGRISIYKHKYMDNIYIEFICGISFKDYIIKIEEKLVNAHREDIDIYEHEWYDTAGFDYDYDTHIYYDNGQVKRISLEEEAVLGVDDREELIDIVKQMPKAYKYIPDKYKYDVKFNLEAIGSYDILEWLPDVMKLNRDILLKCLTNNGHNSWALDEFLFKDCDAKEMFIRGIKETKDNTFNGVDYYVPKILYHDKDFVLKLLEIDSRFIDYRYEYLSDELKIDKDIVDIYAISSHCNIKELDKRVKKTDELVKKMIFSNCSNLKYTKFKNDVEFINELLDNEFDVLEYTNKQIRNNYDIVLKSVKRFPYSLEYASSELRNNKEIVEWAMMSSYNRGSYVFRYAGDTLKNDLEFIEKLLDNGYNVLEYCSDEIKNNYDIVKCVVLNSNYDCKILECVGDKIRNDKDFMRDFFINCNCRFEFTDKRIRKYRRLLKLNNSDFIIRDGFIDDNGKPRGVFVKEYFFYMTDDLLDDLDYIQSLIDELLPF